MQILRTFYKNEIVHKPLTSGVDKGVNALKVLNWELTIFKEEKVHT